MKIETTDKLRTRAAQITLNMWASLPEVIAEMWDCMRANNGIGLAAPQVGIGYQLAVIDVHDGNPLVLINPEVVKREGRRLCTEGCLSLPGQRHAVYRARSIEVWYTDLDGHRQKVRARKNLLAQALEHETDHLRGVLIDTKR